MDGPADFLQKWARFPALPRIFHVPESVRGTKPATPPGTDLFIWEWEDDRGRPTAIVFQGDSNKPLWKYTFGNEAQRRHEIAETIRLRKEELGEGPMTMSSRVVARFQGQAGERTAHARRTWGDRVAKDLVAMAEGDEATALRSFTRAVRGLTHLASEMNQEDVAEALAGAGHVLYGTWGKEARFPTIPRQFHVPDSVRNTPPEVPEGTDLAIWKWTNDKGKPVAVVFQGKSDKPLWKYQFGSESARDHEIDETIKRRREQLAEVQKRRDEKKQFRHNFVKGDILYSSWGYDQTNIDFYEVTDVGDKSIVIREVASKAVGHKTGVVLVMADPGNFVGPPMKKIPQMGYKGDPYVKITSYANAYEWDGTPMHATDTAGGYGH